MHNVLYPPLQYHTEEFHCSVLHLFNPLPTKPDNHRSFYCLCSFAFLLLFLKKEDSQQSIFVVALVLATTHLDRCPPPTTHITEYSCRHTSHMHTAQCAHSLSQTPTQIKQLPPQHSHRDTTGGPPHTSQLHTASHEHSALRD